MFEFLPALMLGIGYFVGGMICLVITVVTLAIVFGNKVFFRYSFESDVQHVSSSGVSNVRAKRTSHENDEVFDIWLRGKEIRPDFRFQALINGTVVAEFNCPHPKWYRHKISAKEGATVPDVKIGDQFELLCNNESLVRGAFVDGRLISS